MKHITYIFQRDRYKKILDESYESEEFFYGATFLLKLGHEVSIIEFDPRANRKNIFLRFIDKLLRKFISLPFYLSELTTIKNIKTIYKSDYLFLINESVGFSSILLLLIVKSFRRVETNLFVMGMFSKKLNYKHTNFLHSMFIKVLISLVDRILFLGEGEFNKASNEYKKFIEKFILFPWSVDNFFWNTNSKLILEENKNILFVGNDGNRDQELLLSIAKMLPNFSFKFVTKLKNLTDCKLHNVEIIHGNWGKNFLSDTQLKEVYLKARFTILPLKESFQPSGQSVAMQSMSLGIPVLISKTQGFWDYKQFINNENIIFIEINETNFWVEKIKKVYYDFELLYSVSNNAKLVINQKFNIDRFNANILKIIEG